MYEVHERLGVKAWEDSPDCGTAADIVARARWLGWNEEKGVRVCGGGAAPLAVVFELEPHGGAGWLLVLADSEGGQDMALLDAVRAEGAEVAWIDSGCLYCLSDLCEGECERVYEEHGEPDHSIPPDPCQDCGGPVDVAGDLRCGDCECKRAHEGQ